MIVKTNWNEESKYFINSLPDTFRTALAINMKKNTGVILRQNIILQFNLNVFCEHVLPYELELVCNSIWSSIGGLAFIFLS